MTDETSSDDTLRAMRDAYGRALEGWSKAMEQAVSTEEFAAASGRILTRYVEFQEAMRAASTAAAEQLRLPTVEDIARLATLIVNVERKVDEVSDEVHAMAGRLDRIEAAVASPPPGAEAPEA